MMNGHLNGELVGSGMVVWKGRELYAKGEISRSEFIDLVGKG
jgi:dihydroxy-acid dehydratase